MFYVEVKNKKKNRITEVESVAISTFNNYVATEFNVFDDIYQYDSLTNSIIDIRETEEYQAEQLAKLKSEKLQLLEVEFNNSLNTPVSFNGVQIKPCYRDLYIDMYNTLKEGFVSSYNVKTADGQLFPVTLLEMTALLKFICPIVDSLYSQKHLKEKAINEADTLEELGNIVI